MFVGPNSLNHQCAHPFVGKTNLLLVYPRKGQHVGHLSGTHMNYLTGPWLRSHLEWLLPWRVHVFWQPRRMKMPLSATFYSIIRRDGQQVMEFIKASFIALLWCSCYLGGGGGISFDKGWWHVAAFEWWIRMPRRSFFVSLRFRNSSMPFLSFLFAYSTCLVTKALTRSSCYWDSSLHDAIRFFK